MFDSAEELIQKIDKQLQDHLKECEKTLKHRGLSYRDMNKVIYQLEVPSNVKVPKDWTVMTKTQVGTVERHKSWGYEIHDRF